MTWQQGVKIEIGRQQRKKAIKLMQMKPRAENSTSKQAQGRGNRRMRSKRKQMRLQASRRMHINGVEGMIKALTK
jgi:hypothetical protein